MKSPAAVTGFAGRKCRDESVYFAQDISLMGLENIMRGTRDQNYVG